jgi:catechol 2,3-dioxygenase-like lactoylglutathione lyase family enzyme
VDPWGSKLEILDDPEMTGFHHVHLKTQDPAATLQWFHQTFGGQEADFRGLKFLPGIRWGEMWLLAQKSNQPVASNANRAIEHIGWKTRDIARLAKTVRDENLKLLVPLTKSGDHQLFFVESPDGVKIEVQDLPH